mgnify:CR=1 FL=1
MKYINTDFWDCYQATCVKKHILECVYDNNEQEFKTIGEAVKHLTNDFKRVADYQNNLKRIPNNCQRFTDYLQNIPFNFEYENYKLESFLNGLEINPNNKEYSSDKMWNLYGLLIFREIEKEYPNFKFYLVLSDATEEDNWKNKESLDGEGDGFSGFVHQSLIDNYLADHPEPEEVEYYFCGPPLMNAAVIKMVDDFGVPPENVSFDDFGG